MTDWLQPHPRPLPAIGCTLALVLFYWGLFRMPGWGSEPDPDTLRRLKDEIAVMQRFGQWKRALKPALQLHRYYPEDPIYLAQLGEIYDHVGQYRESAAMWEGFLDHSPTPIDGCPQIGQAYEKQGLGKQAIGAFERCLALQPGNPDSIFYLARALERNQEIDRAEMLYGQGMKAFPAYTDLTIGNARMRLRQGHPREALSLARAVVDQQPGNVDALLVAGLACRQTGDRRGARTYLERGARSPQGYADFHLILAQIAEEDGDLERAIVHYQKAAALDRTNTAVSDRLALLRKAQP